MSIKPARPARAAGFTLIELMVVLVVVAILGVIAVPSYRQYSIRAQRTEAKTALLQLAANQERFYTQNGNSFTSNLAAVQMTAATEHNRYTLSIDAGASATAFTARATAAAPMSADSECQVFTINAQGVRTATPDPKGACW